MTKQLTCSICLQPIEARGDWTHGNSAYPVNDGRCCDECDVDFVLPMRMRRAGFKPLKTRELTEIVRVGRTSTQKGRL